MYVENPRITFRRNFTKLLASYKEATGYGLRRFAKRCGMTDTMIYDFRTGRRYPSPESMQRLAEAFELPVEVFFRLDL